MISILNIHRTHSSLSSCFVVFVQRDRQGSIPPGLFLWEIKSQDPSLSTSVQLFSLSSFSPSHHHDLAGL